MFIPLAFCQYSPRGDNMCTAVSVGLGTHFFGRNLDLEYTLDERVIITPQKFPFLFRCHKELSDHYAMIGMGIIQREIPLYYEATNEKGLSVAALSFPQAKYCKEKLGTDNIASFELIPWILCQCESVDECKTLLLHTNITDEAFSEEYPPSPLHWLISDRKSSIAVECDGEEVRVWENSGNILTNSPELPLQLFNLNNYMQLSEYLPENRLSPDFRFTTYSKGMGALGLPGDMSSMSRFVRAFFVKEKLTDEGDSSRNLMQFFHLLEAVSMPKGTVKDVYGRDEYTVYSCCCDTNKLIYYYRTYFDFSVRAVKLTGDKRRGRSLIACHLNQGEIIKGESLL